MWKWINSEGIDEENPDYPVKMLIQPPNVPAIFATILYSSCRQDYDTAYVYTMLMLLYYW